MGMEFMNGDLEVALCLCVSGVFFNSVLFFNKNLGVVLRGVLSQFFAFIKVKAKKIIKK